MLLRRSRDLFANEKASVATLFAILLPCLLGFAGIATETGLWYSEKLRIQIASDAAAYSALLDYSISGDLKAAVAAGKREAQYSGFQGSADKIRIEILSSASGDSTYSVATIDDTIPLFFTQLFIRAEILPIGVQSYAAMGSASSNVCMLALNGTVSRSILIAAGVQVGMKNCVAASNSKAADALWMEGSTRLTLDCVSTPGGIGTNGGATLVMNDCTRTDYQRDTHADPLAGTPFWGDPAVPATGIFVDAAISQGRYGPGMPGGGTLSPGAYGKQVEIAGDVLLTPGIYYFSNGFRATNGARIVGNGVTIMVDQSKTVDIAQSVAWDLSAPTGGPTKGVAIMGNPKNTSTNNVRLIGVMGNVEGAIYFPNQPLLTESGPNKTSSACTTLVARSIDIRGNGSIATDCSGKGSGSSGGKDSKVRLVEGPPA